MPVASFVRARRMLSILLLFALVAGGSGQAAWALDRAATFTEPREAAAHGVQLEQQRKWRDAIQLYKKALKDWPDNEHLSYGLRRAQFQFSIERRYTDRTFREELLRLSRQEAYLLFNDVLEKIQSRFVDPISTTSIVAHGTESLWLALANPKFVDENLFGAEPKQIAEFRSLLQRDYWNKPVTYRESARRLIDEIADRAERQLGLDSTAVILEYVFAACNCLDDYSNVLSPGRLSDLYNNIEGEFVGIGIVMEAEIGRGLSLLGVLPESPAAEQGLRPGDYIIRIDGADCRYLGTDEAAGLLTGREGSQVRLEVQAGDESDRRTVVCTRREVQVKSIPVAKIIDEERGIGYIQMTGFQKSSAVELDMALNRLRRQGMQSLIWDLRGNPGGLLTAAVEVLDRFIDQGTLVSTKGRTADQNFSYSAHRPGTWDLPLTLLIDGNSASASEIVAGAVRDHGRGQIVGRQSFGKWSVQSIYPVRNGTGLRLTTAKFYSPDGHSLSKIGVKPDVVIELDDEEAFRRPVADVDVENDRDVQAALRLLGGTPIYTLR
ncbi:putative CtpA-like serine protease [Maioricimonas rarisocia]|uniref:Putative CtpA-like serine protease n=1 Tax=Maioricimonas rarisocia TaxID=2528026 RepID=A0A517ZAF3_9PLAN|nr:S41 family peptidase [Maioricimonas rarisocia]QDU39467.1 putative CtpA-like serine protease [Maioricimonas rarisocia]